MRTFAFIAAAAALGILTAWGAWSGPSKTTPTRGETAKAPPCRRIVSLAPSLTETLFALGLGDRVVGVTRYCDYPEAARDKPKIGGYADPNYEAILETQPDVVFLLDLHEVADAKLRQLGLQTKILEADSVAAILAAIDEIGDRCGKTEESALLRARIQRTLDAVGDKAVSLKARPRVLVVVGGTLGPDGGEVFAAGPGTYLDEVLELAGGRNALKQTPVAYPRLSTESILNLRPDVILDLSAEHTQKVAGDAMARWSKLAATQAVASGNVFLVDGDAATVPGPRVAELAARFAQILAGAAARSRP